MLGQATTHALYTGLVGVAYHLGPVLSRGVRGRLPTLTTFNYIKLHTIQPRGSERLECIFFFNFFTVCSVITKPGCLGCLHGVEGGLVKSPGTVMRVQLVLVAQPYTSSVLDASYGASLF